MNTTIAAGTTTKPSSLIEFGWTQGALARTRNSNAVDCCSQKATRWSVVGAIERAVTNPAERAAIYWTLASDLDLNKSRGTVAALQDWNDDPSRTQSEVLAALAAVGL